VATGGGAVDPQSGDWHGALGSPLPDGQYTLEVLQSDVAGNTGTATTTFRVDATGPAIAVTAPAADAKYAFGEKVAAAFTCADPSGVASCAGTQDAGAPLETFAAGGQRFTVVATDALGNVSTATVSYAVLAALQSPADAALRLTKHSVSGARVTVSGTVAGTGTVRVTATRGRTVRRTTAKIAAGGFTAKLTLPQTSRKARWKLTVEYAGDAGHRAGAATVTVTVPRRRQTP